MADPIDRQAALDCFHSWIDRYGDIHTPDEMPEYRAIEALSSVEPKRTEKRTETHACDCISRQAACEYCHEDSDGYVKPLEKNCHAYIRFGMHGWAVELKAKGWMGEAPINFCPMCGRRLVNG